MAINNDLVRFSRDQLIKHYQKRNSILYIFYAFIRLLSIIVQNIYCITSYLLLTWIVLLPIRLIRSDVYLRIENQLYNWLLFIVSSWSLGAGASIVEAGDDYKRLIESEHENSETPSVSVGEQTESLTMTGQQQDLINHMSNGHVGDHHHHHHQAQRVVGEITNANQNDHHGDNNFSSIEANRIEAKHKDQAETINQTAGTKTRVLLLCNHISTSDVPLMMQAFSTMRNQSVLWVIDAAWKWTNFGLVSYTHSDYFIDKRKFKDGQLRDFVLKYPERNLLVLFPEGGFLSKRLAGSNRYANANGYPTTKFVTHPRFGAFKDLIDPKVGVTHIVDTTLFYDDINSPLSILGIIFGRRKEPTILDYKIYSLKDIEPTEEWLRNLWVEKDKLLQQYYEDRNSVYNKFEGTLRIIKLNWLKLMFVHLFYLMIIFIAFVCYTPLRMLIR